VVVVGAGAAGLMACLELPAGCRVLLLSQGHTPPTASRWAQGGMAAAIATDDSPSLHREDTLRAGAGLCDLAAVDLLVSEAPACVERLLQLGLQLDRRDDGSLSLTLEAAHCRRRVLHARDQTGLALTELLERRVRERPGLCWLADTLVLQLWRDGGRCRGVQVLQNGRLGWLRAGAVVLATGGSGALFSHSTNPPGARGDGLVMAWEAGATLRDMEFVQFHPTALMLDGAPHFLLSEALRGEGARLLDAAGQPVLPSGGELMARDRLSRALRLTMLAQGVDRLWLDLRPVGAARLQRQFPAILERCRSLGLEPLEQPLPISPAAHYWMGGVRTDLQALTDLPGLYAIGEVASSGVHGANRLASNSLMECLVMARQLQGLVPATDRDQTPVEAAPPLELAINPQELELLERDGERLRQLCWRVAGVARDGGSLRSALAEEDRHQRELGLDQPLAAVLASTPCRWHPVDPRQQRWLEALWSRRSLGRVALLLLEAAAFRQESRGGHHRVDAPSPQPFWQRHTLQQRGRAIHSGPVL